MIYWILHKKLTLSDLNNPVEGYPQYFFENIPELKFVDISNMSFYAHIENKNAKVKYTNFADTDSYGERFIKLDTLHQLKQLLNDCSSRDLFVFQTHNNIRVKLFLKYLNKKNQVSLVFNHWHQPLWLKLNKQKEKKNIHYFIKYRKILFQKIVYNLYNKSLPSNLYFDYTFSCGTKHSNNICSEVAVKNILPCHSVPYEDFLVVNKKESQNKAEKYYVFVDQAFLIHPDGSRYFTSEGKEKYKKRIIQSLNHLQSILDFPIVIAEHPRCQYEKEFWGSFNTITGNTLELMKNSAGVLGHFSTALLSAVFFNKKIIYLTDSDKDFPYDSYVKTTYSFTGGDLWDMNSLEKLESSASEVSKITEYFSLIPDNERSNKDIFMDFFKSFLQNDN